MVKQGEVSTIEKDGLTWSRARALVLGWCEGGVGRVRGKGVG